MAQKFVYTTGGRDVTLEDPADDYTPAQIKDHWAATFPELAGATWDTKTGDDGVKVITFAKKVGTKG
jgi:PRTRC genetic system protein C